MPKSDLTGDWRAGMGRALLGLALGACSSESPPFSPGGAASGGGSAGSTATPVAGNASGGSMPVASGGRAGGGGQSGEPSSTDDRPTIDLGLPAAEPQISCPAGAPRPAAGEQPNFLWLVSEDNGPFVGAYGDELARTPHLDALATQGVRFDSAFAPSPVCAPTRFGIFFGIHPATAAGSQDMRNVRHDVLPDSVQGFPKYLRDVGYYTTNNSKTDYNVQLGGRVAAAWNASSGTAHFRNRPAGAPFFSVFNFASTHESVMHSAARNPTTDPAQVQLPPYHPDTPTFRQDWAHYYDAVATMDGQVGAILDQLEADGLAEDTIVFYYSDHGGVLPRSKRFVYDSGSRVPLLVRVPERWCHVLPAPRGGSTDRLVSFVDFAPTLLKLAGAVLPAHLQGQPFLGISPEQEREFVIVARRRMDEQINLNRALRTKKWLYVHNFLPQHPTMSYLEYLYQAPAAAEWDSLYHQGGLDPMQARWFEPVQAAELYEVAADPHQVNDLSADPHYGLVLEGAEAALRDWMLAEHDTGLSLEGFAGGIDYAERSDTQKYPLAELIELAFQGGQVAPENLEALRTALESEHSMERYWAAQGLVVMGAEAAPARPELEAALLDSEPLVRLAAAEALVAQGAVEAARPTLESLLVTPSDPLHRLYAAQAMMSFDEVLQTPQTVFQQALANTQPGEGDYALRRLTYLANK